MPSNIIAPEEGDEVVMADGRHGLVGDIDDIVWEGGNDWQVTVTFDAEETEEEEGTEEVEDELEVHIHPDPDRENRWKEIGG